MDALNDNQRHALSQLHELTNGGDDETAINILESVGWDVQQAANLIFGGAAAPAPNTRLETFDIDDSNQGLLEPNPGRHRARHAQPVASTLFLFARPIISFLAVPLHILANIVRFIFGLLRIPVPQFHLRFVGLNFYRSFPTSRPNNRTHGLTDTGPERWIRELEEETGAVCVGRTRSARLPGAASSAIDAGPSNLTERNVGPSSSVDYLLEDGRKVLPDFMTGSYEEMLRVCKKEARIGCVILVSEEHDDVPAFKRSTLTDPTFVKLLYDNDIAVWGGDVKDREAWSASEKLQATTYPFVAFLALQPRRSPSGSASSHSSSPSLTILSRHQGSSLPASGPTSAATLVSQLERQVLPRVVPFLDVMKAAERERQLERQLREEQDLAYKAAAQRDKERIQARMRKEREEAEEKRRQEEKAKKEQERRLMEDKERQRKEEEKLVWWRWIRRKFSEESSTGADDGPLRVAIRLPNGSRAVKRFRSGASLTTLYAFVASQLIPAHLPEGRDPGTLPYGSIEGSMESCVESKLTTPDCGAQEWWGFCVVNAYPRREIEWRANVRLGDVDCLRGGGQMVVEMLNLDKGRPAPRERTSVTVNDDDDGDDGYDTEE
ncbi:hypothetical protein M378DRAFT_186568 [Amanita muscaria Koide BX008]|uniref:UBX domain-containing protein n=1 Tax=Amanita muscaria (strain Koide BX008) TaxID=946122 RepID=A0A0C2X6M7_AMAMK|nr:hypothetical protein M378DRAFT_186568 [Amanita muscaria Koide BX008]